MAASRLKVLFMGSSAASAECLRAILRESETLEVVGVVSQPDRPAGRGKTLTPCPLAMFAENRGIADMLKPESVNDSASMDWIRAHNPDVIAVVAFGQILKEPLLNLPKHGCVNCHFSLLPKYRGASPVVAALAAGERLTGVTVMHMGIGLDDGPIILQSFEPIYPDTTGGTLMNDLSVAGGVTLAKALKMMAEGTLPPEVPQDPSAATHVRKLKKADGLIDWDAPSIVIERSIRAYNPWPGSYTFLPAHLCRRGTLGRLTVLRSKIVKTLQDEWRTAKPGTVLKVEKGGPIIKCHDTALMLTEVKPEGSGAMSGGAFSSGRPLAAMKDMLSSSPASVS
jgi:methionyl-tRNA formyltransferase